MTKHADVKVVRTVASFSSLLETCDRGQRKLILGLDPGTNCGYAFGFMGRDKRLVFEPAHCGIWSLAVGKYDSGALRFLRLRYFLQETKPDFVCMEGSPFTMGAIVARGKSRGGFGQKSLGVGMDAQAFLAAVRGTIAAWCEEYEVPCQVVEVSEVKRRATGKGNANKLDIIKAANTEFGLSLPADDTSGADNVADAVFILSLAAEQGAAGLVEGGQKFETEPIEKEPEKPIKKPKKSKLRLDQF